MTAFTAYRNGNWSDISNTGPGYRRNTTITAYPGQLNTKRHGSLAGYAVTLNVLPPVPHLVALRSMTSFRQCDGLGDVHAGGHGEDDLRHQPQTALSTSVQAGNLTLGNPATPLSITASGTPAIVVAMGPPGGTATINGNMTGGGSNNAYGVSNAGTCTIYGNVTGGMMMAAYGVMQQRNDDDLRQRHGQR